MLRRYTWEKATEKLQHYRKRSPEASPLYQICAFIQDEHSIKDIMKSQGIPDFQAPPPIPKFSDTVEAIDELPSCDSFEPAPD